MSDKRYIDHPAIVSIDPAGDWIPLWDSSTGIASRAIPNNIVAGAVLPGTNLIAGTVNLTKLALVSQHILLGRSADGTGPVQEVAVSSDFSMSGGVLALSGVFQPADSDLTAIAALTTQPFGRNLLTLADADALRTAAQLLTPTGWGATDKLVTTHNGDVLIDIGAGGNVNFLPVTTATNASVQIFSKGNAPVIIGDDGPVTLLQVASTGIIASGGPVSINNTADAALSGTGALVLLGGIRAFKRVMANGFTTTAGSNLQIYNTDGSNVATVDNVGGVGVGIIRLQTSGTDNGVSITSTTPATSNLTGALRVTGGVGITGALYVGTGDAAHILSDGSAWFGGGEFRVNNDGAIAIAGTKFIVDADANVQHDGIISNEPQYITLGPAATTFTISSSVVILTGDAGTNTIGLIHHPGFEGTRLDIFFVDGFVTITDTAALTPDSVNLFTAYTGSANDILSLRLIGGKWYEIGRSSGVVTDSDLLAIAALTTTSFGRNLLTLANAAALRTAAELPTPTGWANTDKIVTTHSGALLADVGSGGTLNIVPITSATNSNLQLFSKGTGSVIIADDGPTSLITVNSTGIALTGNIVTADTGLLVSASTASSSSVTGALRVTGGVGIAGHLYLGVGDAVHILNDGSAHFGGGQFIIDSSGGLSIGSGNFLVDEDGNTKVDGIFSTTPGAIGLGVGATTFTAVSSAVIITGDGGGNTIGTITGGVNGMILHLYFNDNLVTITDTDAATANTVNLSAAFTSSANDVLTLLFITNKWFEVARSVN